MLSRVAENLYWTGRYIERTENTARIVNVNGNLLLDLPKGFSPGWQPLISISGSEPLYQDRYADFEERNVLKFLVGDARNPNSIVSSVAQARENARTIRDIVPREAWEEINELHLFVRDNVQSGLSKRGRYAYLKRVFRGTQRLVGMLDGAMNHDDGYQFLLMGRNLERADMTTRIIDVRSASLLPDEASGLRPFENIQWMSVLKSLTAYQMYRQKMQGRVRRAAALQFLIQDDEFPRAVYRCVAGTEKSLGELPHNEAPLRSVARLERTIRGANVAAFSQIEIHAFIDELQVGLAEIHDEIARTYFLVGAVTPDVAASA